MDQEQTEHLTRVRTRIAPAIVEFCLMRAGKQFHMDDLRHHVQLRCGYVAPNSAYRVLYDLRKRGVVDYYVVSRAQSLYLVGPQQPLPF